MYEKEHYADSKCIEIVYLCDRLVAKRNFNNNLQHLSSASQGDPKYVKRSRQLN